MSVPDGFAGYEGQLLRSMFALVTSRYNRMADVLVSRAQVDVQMYAKAELQWKGLVFGSASCMV